MDRRQLLRVAALTPLAGMTGVTSQHATGPETVADLDGDLRQLAAVWESTAPADAATLAFDLRLRGQLLAAGTRGSMRADWAALIGRAGLLYGQALTDLGRHGDALSAVTYAAIDAREAGDSATDGMARVLYAHILGLQRPASLVALDTVRHVRHRAGDSWVAAWAAIEEAHLLAGRGQSDEVMPAVLAAEGCALGDGLQFGFPLTGWSAGYVASFGGAALVAAGDYAEAAPRLRDARIWSGPVDGDKPAAPGVNAMTLVYLARLNIRDREPFGAEALCGRALDVDDERPMVARGVLSIADEARARYGLGWGDLRERATGLIST